MNGFVVGVYRSDKKEDGTIELSYLVRLSPEQVQQRKHQLELMLKSYNQQIEEFTKLKEMALDELKHLS